ncbi:hypothetical protein MYCTH_95835 [Thermothelomyces thermophilus ATCC 42464]|uniref:Uncharacterized protein n=1 Tax=Thermothelomyces thermophilus (strain ATCC 42464 / BCRC 31852 / DSM 1799) TaxID=573729 RepID=G2QKD5_THET4|nr:uncharacterized protein MYCTH_95835 [Thermothelomyces thermophilus ATCC 42464]AEO60041.1 hypothetical protein MYCTH_95835 [Thermothelomyces thermophilus ATCC 42464]
MAEAEENAILLANRAGRAPRAEGAIEDNNASAPLGHAAEEENQGEVSEGEANATCDASLTCNTVRDNAAPLSRVPSPQPSPRSQPSLSHQLPTQELVAAIADEPALSAVDTDSTDSHFSPKTAARVRELRDVIASYEADDKTKKWYPEEEELLRILRESELSYHRVAKQQQLIHSFK